MQQELLADLEKYTQRLIDEHHRRVAAGEGTSLWKYSDNEMQWAGIVHYIVDKLVESGFDRNRLTEEKGFGRIVRETS